MLVPPGVAAGRRTLTLANERGAASVDVLVEPTSPGFFTFAHGGKTYPAALIANQRVFVAEPGTFPGEQCRPARPLEYIALHASGLGTSTSHPVGEVLQTAYPILDPSSVSVTVGGKAASVLWAGMTFAGLFQVNVQLPADLTAGDQPIVLSVAGRPSQADVFLPVEAAPANTTHGTAAATPQSTPPGRPTGR